MSLLLELDHYDWQLLRVMQADARLSKVALSEEVNLSPSQCSRRLQRLEQLGLIDHYATHLNRELLGLNVMAFVSVTLEKHGENPAQRFHQAIKEIEAIQEGYSVTGDADYLLRVISEDLKSFSDFLMDQLVAIPGVSHVKSTVVLDCIKSSNQLPLPKQAGSQVVR